MPRTVYGPGPGHRKQTPSELRDTAERLHGTNQQRLFNNPFIIWSSSADEAGRGNDAHASLMWHPEDNLTTIEKTLDQFTPEDCRTFCFKDCPLYVVSKDQSRPWWRKQLYEKIYRRWFPSRAEDVDISHGSFFCRLMAFQCLHGSAVPLSTKRVLEFHTKFCSKLDKLIPDMQAPTTSGWWSSPERSLLLAPAEYKLRSTFKECFILLHADSGMHSIDGDPERGVLIVWLNEEVATRHGCAVDPERCITRVEEDEDLGGALVFRCDTLECAMRLVLATDPQRSEKRREWNGYYEEWLDSGTDTTPVAPCNCNSCQPLV